MLRDEKDVVCVLCQGADEKTRVSEDTRRVLFYAYAVPGVDQGAYPGGIITGRRDDDPFGGGKTEGFRVFLNQCRIIP